MTRQKLRNPFLGRCGWRSYSKHNLWRAFMHLSWASPRGGGTPGWCGGIRGLYGEFETNLCPCGGGNARTLIFECPTLVQNVGNSPLFNWKEIGNDRLFTRSMARWRRRRRHVLKAIVFRLSNRPSVNNLHVFVDIKSYKELQNSPVYILLFTDSEVTVKGHKPSWASW